MKKVWFFIFLFFHLSGHSFAQININSVTTIRQPSGDNGYTLDGSQMIGSRAKLSNPNNFGISGIYQKSISIYDSYGTSGSLMLNTTPVSNIFFFGSFNKLDASTQQFTNAEIDSLYNWSLRGGKLIIAAEPSQSPTWDMSVLDQKWGYHLIKQYPSGFIPTSLGNATEIFNGPFGSVPAAYQGGSLQGYFDALPENSVIYATNGNGMPSLIFDCNTMDLIIADVDGYTSLGGVTSFGNITSNNDMFWANTIVFMDKLQNPPFITNNANTLACTVPYSNYQWYLNSNPISGANEQSYQATQAGSYSVQATLNCGCVLFSNIIVVDSVPEKDTLIIPNVFTPNGDGFNDFFNVKGQNIKNFHVQIFNRWGKLLFEGDNINNVWDGKCNGKNVSAGVYYYLISVVFSDGLTQEKQGCVEVVR